MFKTRKNICKSEDGYIAIVFAIAMVPLLMLMSLAVDYSNVVRKKNELRAAMEGAALQVVRRSVIERDLTAAELQAYGTALIQREMSADVRITAFNIDVSGVTLDISAEYDQRLAFPLVWPEANDGLIVVREKTNALFDIGDSDFYMLLDNSASMGFAATPEAVDQMHDLTAAMRAANGKTRICAFACHNPYSASNDTLGPAEAAGVTLRVDAVRSAVQATLDEMESRASTNQQYRMAVYSYGTDHLNRDTHPIFEHLSSDYESIRTAVEGLELVVNSGRNNRTIAGHFGQSDVVQHLEFFKERLEDDIAIDGNANNKVLFWVTDGVHTTSRLAVRDCSTGVIFTTGWRSCTMPVPPEYCTEIKNLGVRIAILYTEYTEFYGESSWERLVLPFTDDIQPSLEACASPGLFYLVEFGGDTIEEAMVDLFDRTLRALQLSR